MKENDALRDLSGLTALNNVGGYFSIYSNDSLSDVDGLVSLGRVEGDFEIHSNNSLADLDGLVNLAAGVYRLQQALQTRLNRSLGGPSRARMSLADILKKYDPQRMRNYSLLTMDYRNVRRSWRTDHLREINLYRGQRPWVSVTRGYFLHLRK